MNRLMTWLTRHMICLGRLHLNFEKIEQVVEQLTENESV